MSAERFRRLLAAVGLVVVGWLAASAGCRQAKPPTPPAETQPTVPAPQTLPAEPVAATQPVAQTQPAERPGRFEVTEVEAAKPAEPVPPAVAGPDRPLAILGKVDGEKPTRLVATLNSETLLTVRTENVRALRLDLLKLPRESTGRLVLQIDGQGIEITGKNNQIIYLRKSPVGEWSFGRP